MTYTIQGLERLRDEIPERLDWVYRDYRGIGNYPIDKNQTAMREGDISCCLELSTYRHAGLESGEVDIEDFILEGADIAVDYFYGDYIHLNENAAFMMDKKEANENLPWFEAYRDGLFLAVLSGNKKAEQKLIEWIEPWLPFDESGYLVSKEDNSYHKLFAEYLKNGSFASKKLQEKLEKCRKKRPKMLFAILMTIRDQDEEAFNRNFKSFLTYYLKSELGKSGIATHFSIEASLLYHVAKRAGIEPTVLTEKQAALIMTRESLGLAG